MSWDLSFLARTAVDGWRMNGFEACRISAAAATPRHLECSRKMAGRESGPAKKKVITFRGEHRSVKWEENTERIFLF